MAEVLAEGWVTIAEASKRKGAKPQSIQKWLKRNPQVQRQAIGRVIVVRYDELKDYVPRI